MLTSQQVGKGDLYENVLLSHPVEDDFSVQVVSFSTPLTSGEFEVDYIEGIHAWSFKVTELYIT